MRPNLLKDIIGQDSAKSTIRVLVDSAKNQGKYYIPHLLFSSQAGFGKTSLAIVTANELGSNIAITNGGNIKLPKDIIWHIKNCSKNQSVLFIDEIHRVPIRVQEFMYPVLEDFRMDIGETSIGLERFTIIGATTNVGLLSKPFIDRFKIKVSLSEYSELDLCELLRYNVRTQAVIIEENGITEIAKRSRGTPRIALNNLEWILNFSNANNITRISENVIKSALESIGVYDNGFTKNDIDYIKLVKKCGPLGISTISSTLNIDKETIENTIEPFLFSKHLIKKTTKGRTINETARI